MTTKTSEIPGITRSDIYTLGYNAVRDFVLTGSTAIEHIMSTQTLVGSAPMAILAMGKTIDLGRKGKINPERLKEIWLPALANSAGIPMWNVGLMVGSTVGKGALLTASVFAGVFEGFTQWSVKYLADVVTNKVTQEMWRQNPVLMTKLLAKELLLNTTIGMIPGAMWNIVFTLTLSALISAGCPPAAAFLLTAIVISQVALSSSFASGKIIEKANPSIDEWMDWDTLRQDLQKSAEAAVKDRERLELKPNNQPTVVRRSLNKPSSQKNTL